MNKNLSGSNGFIFLEPDSSIRRPICVQCDNSMRLAVLDKSGKWKSFSNDLELTDFVEVCAS